MHRACRVKIAKLVRQEIPNSMPRRSRGKLGAMTEIELRQTAADGIVREFSLQLPAGVLESEISAQLTRKGETVRLPGFRPGKISMDVLRNRYGAGVRAESIDRLISAACRAKLPSGDIVSSAEILGGSESGDVWAKITALTPHDLPDVDFTEWRLEPPAADESDDAGAAAEHWRMQVLDRLDEVYRFPAPPMATAAEFRRLQAAAMQTLEADSNADEFLSDLRAIAERRVRLGLVVMELARRNRIAVDPHGAKPAPQMVEERVISWILSQARAGG